MEDAMDSEIVSIPSKSIVDGVFFSGSCQDKVRSLGTLDVDDDEPCEDGDGGFGAVIFASGFKNALKGNMLSLRSPPHESGTLSVEALESESFW